MRRKAIQQERRINGDGMGTPLAMAAKIWPTPAARDWLSDSSQQSDEELYGTKGRPLARTAEQWMTPRVSETGQYQYNKGNKDDPVLTLQGQSQAMPDLRSSLPDLPISMVGEESSKIRRSLNPLFVEWLMGWPPGWTLLAPMPPASNGCACSATALSRFRLRMRSALFALGLPPEAPKAQLSLFGS